MQISRQLSTTSSKHVCTEHCLHEAKGSTSDYWRSPKGITRRIDMLAQGLTYKTVNNSLMFYGQSAGIQWVRWHTMADERVCFPAGTLITTLDGERPIEDIQVGDAVLTRVGYKKVIATTNRPYAGLMATIEHEAGKLTSTVKHPVWKVGAGWLDAFQIKPGDFLKAINTTYRVAQTLRHFSTTTVYNLEVEDEPEYFANGVLVHNCPICGPLEGRIYRKGQFLPPLPAHSQCRCRWELILTQTPEAPTVDRIILPDAEGYDISASTWQSMVKILSATIVSLLILTADQTASRVKAYKELEAMMRNRGYNFIIMDIPDDEEEERWWLNRGFIRDGERLVRRIN